MIFFEFCTSPVTEGVVAEVRVPSGTQARLIDRRPSVQGQISEL